MAQWAKEAWAGLTYGWTPVYWLRIAGIPVVWSERALGLSLPTGFATDSATLVIEDGPLGIESVDRDRGLGVSTPCECKLLDSAALFDLIKAPTLQTRLKADAGATDTALQVDSTAGWPSSGALWLGRERITYSGTSADQFTGCTRGTCGSLARAYRVGTMDQVVTNRPLYWRGLDVTLWATMVSPSGKPCGTALESDESVEVWHGRLSAPPRRERDGFRLAAESLERLLDRELGQSLRGDLIEANSWARVWTGEQATIWATALESNGTTQVWDHKFTFAPWAELGNGYVVAHRDVLHATLQAALEAAVAAESAGGDINFTVAPWLVTYNGQPNFPWYWGVRADIEPDADIRFVRLRIVLGTEFLGEQLIQQFALGSEVTYVHTRWLWYGVPAQVAKTGFNSNVPSQGPGSSPLTSVVAELTEGVPDDTPAGGQLRIRAGNADAVYRYDEVTVDGPRAVFSGLQPEPGTPLLTDGSLEGGTVEVLDIDEGSVHDVALRALQSSGTGARGDYDTLTSSQGYAIDESRINVASFARAKAPPLALLNLRVSASGAAFPRLVGEALALADLAVVLRPDYSQTGGPLQLALVHVGPTDIDLATITDADLCYRDGAPAVRLRERADPPNLLTVLAEPAGAPSTTRVALANALGIAANGATKVEHHVDATDRDQLVAATLVAGPPRFLDSELQQALELTVRPDVQCEVGDCVRLELTDPTVYNWTNGSTGYTGLARVLGKQRDPLLGLVTLLVVYGGLQVEAVAPSMRVLGFVGDYDDPTSIDVAPQYLPHLQRALLEGPFELVLYRPGYAESSAHRYQVTEVVDAGTEARLTVSISAGAPELDDTLTIPEYLTLPPADDASAYQQQFTAVGDGSLWT